ncbi:hypothetical protein [Paenalkalicoccus suaedae]|uniref:hypothetical protein n=1 Tax=Paenalkalicoccus suaedae TaxID=2592382 RepID=UPI00158DC066|nr:hypothetical protein [Paenalkalicoccus suaedae]
MGNREQFDLSKYLLEKRKQKGLSQTQVANDTGYIKTKLQHDFDGPYPVFTKLIIN